MEAAPLFRLRDKVYGVQTLGPNGNDWSVAMPMVITLRWLVPR